MKEHEKRLHTLREKIDKFWSVLDIDSKEEEIITLAKDMESPQFWSDQESAVSVSKRYEGLRREVDIWKNLKKGIDELLLLEDDLDKTPDEELEKELIGQLEKYEDQAHDLEFYTLLDGKNDRRSAIIAFHAGSGGTEAQDWADMLMRMITRYAEKKGWAVTVLDQSRGAEVGIKSAMIRVEGEYVYGHLKSEHGTHRLVRISPFDAEAMRHTTFALIEVIPEMPHGESIEIDVKDLRIDTFLAGGHGGQSVNTTYSAVRIVHIPTGITVQCQNERSQLQNKETAMKVLVSKLQKLREEEEEKERLELRGEHKSAEWGNQIRSYVLHPYKMVKDLRTRYEESDPEAVLSGKIDGFVEAYLTNLREDKS
jgi:peptide chain release factor 2